MSKTETTSWTFIRTGSGFEVWAADGREPQQIFKAFIMVIALAGQGRMPSGTFEPRVRC